MAAATRSGRARLLRVASVWTTLAILLASTLLAPGAELDPTMDDAAPAAAAALPASDAPGDVLDSTSAAAPPAPTPRPETNRPLAAAPDRLAQPTAWLARVERGTRAGLATVISADGLLVSTHNTIDGTQPIRVWLPGREPVFAEILFEDTDTGLALLSVPVATPDVASVEPEAPPEPGQAVVLVSLGQGREDPLVGTPAVVVDTRPDLAGWVAFQPAAAGAVAPEDGVLLSTFDGSASLVGIGAASDDGEGTWLAVSPEQVLAFVAEGSSSWVARSREPALSMAAPAPSRVTAAAMAEPQAVVTRPAGAPAASVARAAPPAVGVTRSAPARVAPRPAAPPAAVPARPSASLSVASAPTSGRPTSPSSGMTATVRPSPTPPRGGNAPTAPTTARPAPAPASKRPATPTPASSRPAPTSPRRP